MPEPGEELGLYASIGWELALGEHWRIGPDLALFFVTLESSGKLDVVPQLAWRLSYGF